MEIKELKEIMRTFCQSEIAYLSYKSGEDEIVLKKEAERADMPAMPHMPYPIAQPQFFGAGASGNYFPADGSASGGMYPPNQGAPASGGMYQPNYAAPSEASAQGGVNATQCAAEPVADSANNYVPVKAPLVGIYYEASAPGKKPYAAVGERVEKGQVLCLIEAMKMINEVRSPVSGVVKSINSQNEALVSFGDVLMEIEEA